MANSKLRPYRVDFFDIEEMQHPDKALVQSVIVRAVTATEAIDQIATDRSANNKPLDTIIIIRAYRFYGQLGAHKQDVYRAVEDLFTANKAVEAMRNVEAFRTARRAAELNANAPVRDTPEDSSTIPGEEHTNPPGADPDNVIGWLTGAAKSVKVIDPEPRWSGGLKIPIAISPPVPDVPVSPSVPVVQEEVIPPTSWKAATLALQFWEKMVIFCVLVVVLVLLLKVFVK